MCEGTDYLNANPDVIAEFLLEANGNIDEMLRLHPLVQEWAVEQGYSFEPGMFGECYLTRHWKIAQGPDSGPGAASRLLSAELKRLIEEMVGVSID